MKYWAVFSSLCVSLFIALLLVFIAFNTMTGLSFELFFGDTKPLDAIFNNALVWNGLWTPLWGSIRLFLITGIFTVPMGLAVGIYTSEYSSHRLQRRLILLFESFTAIPSIIIGLFGFVLILFLRKHFFPAHTGMLLAAFCLTLLVLPTLALNTYNALQAVPAALRITALSLGMPRQSILFKLLIPNAREGMLSGLLLSAGRCIEDTAVILMTGAVASAGGATGLFDKFEALPFFIYYTSANYTNSAQLTQVFAAAFILLVLTFALMLFSMLLKRNDSWM